MVKFLFIAVELKAESNTSIKQGNHCPLLGDPANSKSRFKLAAWMKENQNNLNILKKNTVLQLKIDLIVDVESDKIGRRLK